MLLFFARKPARIFMMRPARYRRRAMNYSRASEEGDRAGDAIIRRDGERVRKGAKKGDEEE